MARGDNEDLSSLAGGGRPTKSARRIGAIIGRIPSARAQLAVGIADLGAPFDVQTVTAAATSPDPRERNKVAVIERETDVLISWLEELADRSLSEARRIGKISRGPKGWSGLSELGVIPEAMAERLQDAKEIRNQFAHAYPPAVWESLVDSASILEAETDRYLIKVAAWLRSIDLLPA